MNDTKQHILNRIQEDLQNYPRMHGYYLIGITSIHDKRQAQWDEETILNWAFQKLDDQQWPTLEPGHDALAQTWIHDYQTTQKVALEELTLALIGGGYVGHTVNTIAPRQAPDIANRFDALFQHPKKYFYRMGFGDRTYVFQTGIGIMDKETVGIFFVVESD